MSRTSRVSRKGISPKRWIQRLEAQVPVARAGRDPEGVHQMRVAIARLRVWLALAEHAGRSKPLRRLDRELAWLRDEVARVRDYDVHLEANPPARVAARLREERKRARRAMLAALGDPRVERLFAQLRALPALPAARAAEALPVFAKRVRVRARDWKRDGIDALHRLRRAVRGLRFALEWLGEDARLFEALQGALGDACDAAFASGALRPGRARKYHAVLARRRRAAEKDAKKALRRASESLELIAKRGARS